LRAEESFRKGRDRLDAGDIAQAHALFRQAVDIYPLEATFFAYLGWTQFELHPARAEEAVSLLERAVELNPTLERAYLYLARIRIAQGLVGAAEAQYEKALVCNPACEEALQALRLTAK
jgi:tetratricopeptide (TPR) repeat protein